MKLQLVLAVYETLYWAHSRLKASQCVNGLPWCECALGCIRNIININTVGINNHGLSRFSPAAQSSLFFALYFSYANGIVFTRLLCPILVVDLLIYFSLWSRLVFSVKVNISYTCRITINYFAYSRFKQNKSVNISIGNNIAFNSICYQTIVNIL